MGGCVSSPAPPGGEVSERDRALHRQAEKALKEAKAKMAVQVKVLLLGSGDSGKSTILKQMRLIHKVPFSAQETESFRQLVFDNLTRGLKYLLDALPDMGLALPEVYSNLDAEGYVKGWAPGECGGRRPRKRAKSVGEKTPGEQEDEGWGEEGVRGEGISADLDLLEHAEDLRDGEPFPSRYFGRGLFLNKPALLMGGLCAVYTRLIHGCQPADLARDPILKLIDNRPNAWAHGTRSAD